MKSIETTLIELGRDTERQHGYINPPIYKGSTVLYDDVESLREAFHSPLQTTGRVYGRLGTPSSRAFESAMTELEGGFATVTTNSGLSALTTAIQALVRSGDHLLVTDSVYYPTRKFCDSLARFGIETEYYDPTIGADIKKLFRPNTRLVFLESPGSLTFEVQDIPAIAKVCRDKDILTLIDNTWATPLFLQPIRVGVDVSIHSGTKYITGHSDSYLGVIICNEETYAPIRTESIRIGQCASPDDIHLGLRGLRTLSVRLNKHQEQALDLARWLSARPEIDEVLFPALPGSSGHELWKRDFRGAAGVFSVVLRPGTPGAGMDAMLNGMRHFKLGFSYGGFESLIVPFELAFRKTGPWQNRGTIVRLQIGLESVEDLRADLSQGLDRLNKV